MDTYAGFDCNFPLKEAQIDGLKDAGYSWVGRYYSYPGAYKNLQLRELKQLSKLEIPVVVFFERAPVNLKWFVDQQNAGLDADYGIRAAHTMDQPCGTPIFYAVDYDAPASDLDTIGAYFGKVQDVVKRYGYLVGGYGSGLVLEYLLDKGYISHTVLSQARGWAGYAGLENPNIRQGATTDITLAGSTINVDLDTAYGTNFGGWVLPQPKAEEVTKVD